MIKRLSISLVLLSLAIFALGAAASAFFSDSGTGHVTVSAANVDLRFRVDNDCNGGPTDGYDTGWFQADPSPFAFDWANAVPGDTTADCIEVQNHGSSGDLTVYALHSGFDGNATLRNSTLWKYNAVGSGSLNCDFSVPQDAQYTAGRGCLLDTIGPGESFVLRVDVEFVDNGSDQNPLQGESFWFDSVLTGYTG